ncbi:MAG: hypothetical protein GY737_12230 [Desulfobacteraceae bacterium]|nr:hypothetical protein [Desulfobacteraceae bacterium]
MKHQEKKTIHPQLCEWGVLSHLKLTWQQQMFASFSTLASQCERFSESVSQICKFLPKRQEDLQKALPEKRHKAEQ